MPDPPDRWYPALRQRPLGWDEQQAPASAPPDLSDAAIADQVIMDLNAVVAAQREQIRLLRTENQRLRRTLRAWIEYAL